MENFMFPIIMLAVTLIGGGILILFLKSGTKRPLTENENAAMVTAQQFINIKDSQDKYLYTRDGMIFVYLRIHAISIDLFSKSEKNVLIKTLTAELSDIQYPFKFLALSRPVDISPLITEMGDMLKKASLLCEKFAAGGVVTDILTKKEIVRLVNLVNNPSYTHLEDAETSASIPTLKGVM